MADIVDRLRDLADLFEAQHAPGNLVLHMRAGADEIERKKDEIASLLNALADERTESMRLRAALEIMSMMGGYTKLHPDETAPGVEQNTYSWGVSDGYKEMADIARAALEEGRT